MHPTQATDLAVKPDAIVTVCGGGGLLLGILQGLEDVGWEGTPVLVAETAGADSLNQSLAAGELVTLPAITSVAKSLGARRISETAFNKCRDLGPSKVRL
jgi:L-serine/L-threonine ammonia-lyase